MYMPRLESTEAEKKLLMQTLLWGNHEAELIFTVISLVRLAKGENLAAIFAAMDDADKFGLARAVKLFVQVIRIALHLQVLIKKLLRATTEHQL